MSNDVMLALHEHAVDHPDAMQLVAQIGGIGMLMQGKHDIVAHRRLYLDEDTWLAVYSDAWDEQGKLWKFGQGTMYLMPDVPAVIMGNQFDYDFELGGYAYGFAFNAAATAYK